MDIPTGLTVGDEFDVVRRLQWRENMQTMIGWLMQLRPDWSVKADLTYAKEHASPEQCEKRVRWWLRKVAPGAWAICGIELQDRGSAHAHVIIDRPIDFKRARKLWEEGAGFCWFRSIFNQQGALTYAIKDAVKRGEVIIYGPGAEGAPFSTRPIVRSRGSKQTGRSPNQYEMAALSKLSGTSVANDPLPAPVTDATGTVNPLPEGRRSGPWDSSAVIKFHQRRRG